MRTGAVLFFFLAACGGKLVTGSEAGDENSQSSAKAVQAPSSSSSSASASARAASTDDEAAALPATTLAASGTCATRKPTDGSISSEGAPRCQVKNRIAYPDGRVEIELVDGDAGAAKLDNGDLVLTCGTKGKLLFQAVIRCYAFDGDYRIAQGDLILGDQISDRACRLDVDDNGTDVSGFVSCDDAGASELFSSNGAPIGLGAFTLPRAK